MRKSIFIALLLLSGFEALAQSINIEVKVNSGRIPVSPYLYGRNNSFSDVFGTATPASSINLYKEAGLRFTREGGGNNSTKYNWRKKLSSHPDWYNNVYSHDWDYSSKSIQSNMPGLQTMWSFQLIGKAAANKNNNFNDWAYNSSKWWEGCSQNLAGGGVINAAGGNKASKEGDPSKYLMNWNSDSTTGIINHFFGAGSIGLQPNQFLYWSMDNEPEIWSGTHDDVMPIQLPADSFMTLYFETAKKARTLFPAIKLTGPVPANEWQWFNWGSESLKINGTNYCWLEYFIKRIADEQKATGIRLLDVVDIHFYPEETSNAQVLQLHRVFFDKNYIYPGANGIRKINGGWDTSQNKEYILQRVRDWLNKYLGEGHGVGLAITEMDLKASNTNVHSVLYASMLGTFANHGVEVYTPWTWKTGMWEVLHLYSRYAREISVSTTSSAETSVSGYSTISAKGDSLTIILVNRDVSLAKNAIVNISDFAVKDGTFSTYQLASLPETETFKSHSNNALKKNTVKVDNASFQLVLPKLSITAVVLHNYETGVQDFGTRQKIKLFVDDSRAEVSVSFQYRPASPSSFILYDQGGRIVEKFEQGNQELDSFTLSTKHYQKGLYFLKVKNREFTACEKLVIQ